ncbi:MAG: ExeA family protein [Gemmataceae bacterium]
MSESGTGRKRRLFPNTPDTELYYPATDHERVLGRLQQAIADSEGLMLLAGEPGTGKTLLCHCLLERLGPDVCCAFLTNSHFPNAAGLLQALLYEFSMPYEERGEQELRLALTDFLLKNYSQNRQTILIIDESQNLMPEHLEELRLLGNLEARGGKAVQILLSGQMSALECISRPEADAFRQRLATRLILDRLSLEEAADYLHHHVRAAGAQLGELFTEEALALLARGTKGIPRLLNQAAHQSLQLAEEAESMPVDAEAALEALSGLDLEAPEYESPEDLPALSVDGTDQLAANNAEGPAGKASLLGRFSVLS